MTFYRRTINEILIKKLKSSSWRAPLASWRDTVTSSWHCSTARELIERITSFLFESYVSGVKEWKGFFLNEAVIVTRNVTSWRDTVTSSGQYCSTYILGTIIARIESFLFWILSEGTIQEKRFLRLLTTAVELTSCRHPTSPQRASTFPEETQNSLYIVICNSPCYATEDRCQQCELYKYYYYYYYYYSSTGSWQWRLTWAILYVAACINSANFAASSDRWPSTAGAHLPRTAFNCC